MARKVIRPGGRPRVVICYRPAQPVSGDELQAPGDQMIPTSTGPAVIGSQMAETPDLQALVDVAARAADRNERHLQALEEPAVTDQNIPKQTSIPALWEGQRVKIEDLPAFKAKWGLRTVAGDPDLDGQPWTPKLYLVPMRSS
jgi:hypothetical protein